MVFSRQERKAIHIYFKIAESVFCYLYSLEKVRFHIFIGHISLFGFRCKGAAEG